MSISYNKVILVGRLTADPEITFAQNGMQISKFILAVDRQYQKDKQQEADFLRIISFGKLAEIVRDYLRKGSLIMVEGRIQTSRFTGQDGVTKYYTDIIAEKINFMETKKSQNKSTSLPEIPNNSPESLEKDADEVPFDPTNT